MRKDEIKVGGKPYKVVGLSVMQSIELDLEGLEISKSGSAKEKARLRFRRMAIALQNAQEFLPDPKDKTGKGQFKTDDRTFDEVVDALAEAFQGNMEEFYAAESIVHRMNWPIAPKAGAAGEAQPEGEKPATE